MFHERVKRLELRAWSHPPAPRPFFLRPIARRWSRASSPLYWARHLYRQKVMEQAATVYIVDDDAAIRDGLSWLLSSVNLRARAYASADEFLADWDPRRPGCLLLDLRMPGTSGLELQEQLVKAGHRIPIIFLSGHGDVPTAVRAMQAGAAEFLTKPFSERFLLERVQAALEQDIKQRRQQRLNEEVTARYSVLTPREREVLHLVVAGKVNREIAAELSISPKTVELHRSNLMKKMHADSVPSLVAMCLTIDECRQSIGVLSD
jgi:two-component system response regulator FixJ